MVDIITFDQETRSFSRSTTKSDIKGKMLGTLAIMGTSLAINLIGAVTKVALRRYGAKKKDELLQSRNDRLNRLSDKYAVEGVAAKTDKESVEKYKKELHALFDETLAVIQSNKRGSDDPYSNDVNINVIQDQYGSTRSIKRESNGDPNSILNTYINPFFAVLRMVLITPVHIIPGTGLGADRRNFELVFDPDHKNPEDAAKEPFRSVLFRYPWPSHGFETSTRGQMEANKLINETIEFLAENPKYLAIRV